MSLMTSASAAKISRPRISGIYQRVRLFSLLDEQKDIPVIWITSPPGAGKTTLISSYLETRNCTTLWYQVDEGDKDISTFFYYLGLATRKASPRRRKKLPLLTPEYKLGITTFTRNFFRGLYNCFADDFVIVFDNYQDAGDCSELHSAIVTGLEELPDSGRIFVISRTDPPKNFARLRVNNKIRQLQWEDIRLTEEELENILILKGRSDLPVEVLHARTRGWVAGLTLLLEQSHIEWHAAVEDSHFNPETLFDYFAGEILERVDEGTRKFLVKTSLLPKFSSSMAIRLTGINDTLKILNNLLVKNYFTYRHEGGNPAYEYHPLFREFLLTRTRDFLSDIELTVAKWNAAEVLQQDNQLEAAVQLLIDVADWEKLACLVKGSAEGLLKQGRLKTLADWISKIPQGFAESDPWLLYWHGAAVYPFDPDASLPHLQRAFELFRKNLDSSGVYLAWAAATEASRTGSQGEVSQLDYWISILYELMEQFPEFPDTDIEARAALVMHTAIVWRMPGHPDRDKWRERLVDVWRKVKDPALFSEIGVYTASHDMIVGNNNDAMQVFDTLKRVIPEEQMPPIARIVMYLTDSFINWRMGESGKSVESARRGIKYAYETGVHLWDEFIISQGMSGALIGGDLDTARELREQLQGSPQGFRSAYYHYVESWYHVFNHDIAAARQAGELALKSARESGTPFFEALAHIAMSTTMLRSGVFDEGRKELDAALYIGRTCRLASIIFRSLLDLAYWAFREGDGKTGIACLKESLAIGREKGYVAFAYWLPDMISEIFVRALEEDIETEYVKHLINKLDIMPVPPPLHLDNWPWQFRIRCLGHFELLKNGKPVEFSRKVQKKPVHLVKALVAFGGQDVPDEKIIEALWPDAEADAGHKSLATTLHRARRLLGDEAIYHQEGRISLDGKRVWTDVRAFDHMLAGFDHVPAGSLAEEHARAVERALSLYKGHFLTDDLDFHWAIPLRETLRNKFIRCVEKIGAVLEEGNNYEKAIYWYRRGLEIDLFAEQFYQRLMYCYGKLDRKSEAVETYRQCFRLLTSNLKVEPSGKTKAIYQGICN